MNDADEEWWAEQDRRMRLLEKLRKAFIYLAGMALCAALLFVLLFFGVRNIGEGKYDHWAVKSPLKVDTSFLRCIV